METTLFFSTPPFFSQKTWLGITEGVACLANNRIVAYAQRLIF